MINQFLLKNIASRLLPQKLPPYFAFHPTLVGEVPPPSYDELEQLTEEELADFVRTNALGIPMVLPLSVKTDDGDWWTLPYEPLISLSGKNVIIKKQISKGKVRGTIKERWTQDDYSVSISGIFFGENGEYPDEDVQRLRRLCENAKLQVSCPLFEIFSITQIVVESWEFPFTSGRQNQAFTISAVSDDIFKLLLKKEDLKQQ